MGVNRRVRKMAARFGLVACYLGGGLWSLHSPRQDNEAVGYLEYRDDLPGGKWEAGVFLDHEGGPDCNDPPVVKHFDRVKDALEIVA